LQQKAFSKCKNVNTADFYEIIIQLTCNYSLLLYLSPFFFLSVRFSLFLIRLSIKVEKNFIDILIINETVFTYLSVKLSVLYLFNDLLHSEKKYHYKIPRRIRAEQNLFKNVASDLRFKKNFSFIDKLFK